MDRIDQCGHFSGHNVQEDQILHAIEAFASTPSGVLVGPGDDAAVLSPVNSPLVVSVDQCIEGLHFLPGTDLEQVGVKAVRRAAGDLAAMAAAPLGLVATALLPPEMAHDDAICLYRSIQSESERLECPLVGGDTCIRKGQGLTGLHLSVTVIGHAQHPALRSHATPGDRLFVTGQLGGSFASGRHLRPPVRIKEALRLRDQLRDGLHAMVDVSDGLGKDAMAIALASGVKIEIQKDSIPCHPGATWKDAIQDGEDHELLFTVSREIEPQDIPVPAREIGVVLDAQPSVTVCDSDGPDVEVGHEGWSHEA